MPTDAASVRRSCATRSGSLPRVPLQIRAVDLQRSNHSRASPPCDRRVRRWAIDAPPGSTDIVQKGLQRTRAIDVSAGQASDAPLASVGATANASKSSNAGKVAGSASVVEGTNTSDASSSLASASHLGLGDRRPTQHLSLASHACVVCFSTRNTPVTSPLSLMSCSKYVYH
jgi:hypothetical protein